MPCIMNIGKSLADARVVLHRPKRSTGVEREWHHDEGQNRHREEVEGGVVVLELIVFATLLAFEVVLEI